MQVKFYHDLVKCLLKQVNNYDIRIPRSTFALLYFLFPNFPPDCIYDPLKSDNQIVYLLSKLSILQIMSSLHKK